MTAPRTWGTLPVGAVPHVPAHVPCDGEDHTFAPEALLPGTGPTTVLCGCGAVQARTSDGVTWQFGSAR